MFFFFKQKTAYEMRISDWSSDVCSSDLVVAAIDHALSSAAAHLRHIVEQAPAGRGLEALVRSYLSIGHRDRAELGCAASALAPEIARESLQIGRASCRERVCQYV